MKNILGAVAGTMLLLAVPAAAGAVEPAAAAQGDQAAKLAEAHAIVQVMYPPEQRNQMIEKIQTEMVDQLRGTIPAFLTADAGMKAIVDAYIKDSLDRQRPIIIGHLPALVEAISGAYTRQFSLAELKQIHAFAATPAGSHYLSQFTAVLGDPAVAEVNKQMFVELHALSKDMMPGLKEKVLAYLKAHPDVAAQVAAAAGKGQPETK